MSEHTLASSNFPQAIPAAGLEPKRLPVGVAMLTVALASGLVWAGIYATLRSLVGF